MRRIVRGVTFPPGGYTYLRFAIRASQVTSDRLKASWVVSTFPGPEIWEKASQAAATADDALAKYR